MPFKEERANNKHVTLSFTNDILPQSFLSILNTSRETIINFSAIDGDDYDSKLADVENYLNDCMKNPKFTGYVHEIDGLLLLCEERKVNSKESWSEFDDLLEMIKTIRVINK